MLKSNIPSIVLAPLVSTKAALGANSAPANWASFARAAGSTTISQQPPAGLQLKPLRHADIVIKPFYAPARNGRPSREDDSPISEEINEVLSQGNEARTRQIFNSDQAVRDLLWSFDAKSLKSGNAVAVKTAGAAAGEVQVQFPSAKPVRSIARIQFPPTSDGDVYEVKGQAEVVDALGNRTTVEQTVWSHALTAADQAQLASGLLLVAAQIGGSEPAKLMAASGFENSGQEGARETNPFARCARMVRLFSMRAAQDGMVTVDELRQAGALSRVCNGR